MFSSSGIMCSCWALSIIFLSTSPLLLLFFFFTLVLRNPFRGLRIPPLAVTSESLICLWMRSAFINGIPFNWLLLMALMCVYAWSGRRKFGAWPDLVLEVGQCMSIMGCMVDGVTGQQLHFLLGEYIDCGYWRSWIDWEPPKMIDGVSAACQYQLMLKINSVFVNIEHHFASCVEKISCRYQRWMR